MIKTTTCLIGITFFCLLSRPAHCQLITTIASGTTIGDGGTALNAAFGGPTSIGFDRKGNTFIVDTDDNRIRKIDANGIVTTLAGDGELGFAGDGGPATNARFIWPRGVAVDRDGNVYFADDQNHRIRKVDVNGTITTIAGTANQGFSGDGGAAVSARLNFPQYVTIDKTGNGMVVLNRTVFLLNFRCYGKSQQTNPETS